MEARSQDDIQQHMGLSVLPADQSNLLVQFTYDNDSGTTIGDTADNYDGQLYNSMPFNEVNNRALSFDGTDDYLELDDVITEMAQADFTIETWVKTSSGGDIFVKTDGDVNYESGEKRFAMWGGKVVFAGWGNSQIRANTSIADGQWHHVAVVWNYDGTSSGTGTIYVDGEDDTNTSYQYNPQKIDNSTDSIKIGYPPGGNALNYFNGDIDELRFWSIARTQAEIQANMHSALEGTESGLAAYYDFEEGGNDTVMDRTGNGYDGTLINGPTRTAADARLYSTERTMSFDGTDGYVELPADTWFNGDLTIEAWVYPRSYNNWSRLVDIGNGPKSDNVLVALSKGTTGKPRFDIYKDGSATNVTSSQTLSLDTWSHLAVTLSGSTGVMYINGEQVAINSIMNIPNDIERLNAYIGRSNWSNDSYADAQFDEVRIWNAALSQTDIQANMNLQLTGKENNLVAYYSFEDGAATDMTGNGHDATLYGNTSPDYRGIGVTITGSSDLEGVLPTGSSSGFSIYTQPTLGSVTVDNSTGGFTYSPTDSSETGTDSFSYRVWDDNYNISYSETVTITLEGLSLDGGTGGSSVSASTLLDQLQQNLTQAEDVCTQQSYYSVGEERLQRYNGMPYLAGMELIENPVNGALEMQTGDAVYGLQPYDLVFGGNDTVNMMEQVITIGADNEVLFTRPALIDPCALEQLIGPFTLNPKGLLQMAGDNSDIYLATPAWGAFMVETGEDDLFLNPLPGSESLLHVVIQFNNEQGTWQQILHPALYDRKQVENFLGDFLEDVGNGKLAYTIDGQLQHFIPDYLVTQTSVEGSLSFQELGDKNEDGLLDFAILYPDGIRQELYGVNIVEE